MSRELGAIQGIKVWATLKGEDEPRVLELFLAQARTRNSTLWADDPRQQLAYLAIKRWSRLYCPDVIMGIYTPDELLEVAPEREINPPPTGNRALDAMRSQHAAPRQAATPLEVEEDPAQEEPAPVDHANAYADHCAAIEGASDTAEWQQAYATAWAWANETGEKTIISGIKQIAGERKAQLSKAK